MRVVIDANVLISFLLTGGETISKILYSWKQKKFTLLVNHEILLEVRQVLERFVIAKMVDAKSASALVRRLEIDSEIIPMHSQIEISPDKKDNRYLACAKDGSADYLVTGDKKHLLKFGKFEKTEIISPAQFVKVLWRFG